MPEISRFGLLVLGIAGAFSLAVLSTKASRGLRVPAPAFFLLGAAVVAQLFPTLREHLSILAVERIGVVALIVILFEGGMHVGWRRFRAAAAPIVVLGIAGTFATAALAALLAHFVLGLGWLVACLLGAAVAPTDPAVMFSVLGNREVGGRAGTILEGESGANDPVGIALMIGLLAYATSSHGTPWTAVRELAVALSVGLAIGVAGGLGLRQLMRRMPLPREGLYPLRALAGAGLIYGVAAVAHGSGFLAVFVAGLAVGDARAPFKAEIERFHASLASLAEIVVFVALGLTIELSALGHGRLWLDGIVLAVLLALVIRPLVVVPLLARARLRRGEQAFVVWGGLKGAVPILLAALAVLDGAADAHRIYQLVFVVVAFSVVVQGGTIPLAARRLGVPMRTVEPEPWNISIRLREEPEGVQRFVVRRGSRAHGSTPAELPLGDSGWISLIVRADRPLEARGSTVLEADDEVLVLAPPAARDELRALFEGP